MLTYCASKVAVQPKPKRKRNKKNNWWEDMMKKILPEPEPIYMPMPIPIPIEEDLFFDP